MSARFVMECARIDCDATREVELSDVNMVSARNQLTPVVVGYLSEDLEDDDDLDQWGYDRVGADSVLHCPEHRS